MLTYLVVASEGRHPLPEAAVEVLGIVLSVADT